MIALARFFDWRDALVIVKPETFIRWHRTAFKVFWRWRSRKRVRPALPRNLQGGCWARREAPPISASQAPPSQLRNQTDAHQVAGPRYNLVPDARVETGAISVIVN